MACPRSSSRSSRREPKKLRGVASGAFHLPQSESKTYSKKQCKLWLARQAVSAAGAQVNCLDVPEEGVEIPAEVGELAVSAADGLGAAGGRRARSDEQRWLPRAAAGGGGRGRLSGNGPPPPPSPQQADSRERRGCRAHGQSSAPGNFVARCPCSFLFAGKVTDAAAESCAPKCRPSSPPSPPSGAAATAAGGLSPTARRLAWWTWRV